MNKQIGLYLHIPFCARKCAYCDFASYAGAEKWMGAYVERVIQEMQEKSREDLEIATLFISGGTPSLLPPDLMEKLLSALHRHFSILPHAEFTCECNPGTVTEHFLSVLKNHGVNRLSFGAQASQPRLLSLLGRIHTWEQVAESVSLARKMGFDNLNLDLMLALPGQTIADVKDTLRAALALSPTHLSCYGLIVEEGTKMHAQVENGLWQLPDEETERQMYECCRETLFAHGFQQYEISNFSLPGKECRHNMDCWKRKEYVGLGSAACGFLAEKRYQNPPDLQDYLQGLPPEITAISPEDARFESVMLGLRMTDGISEAAFEQMHGISLEACFGEKMKKPLEEGMLIRQNGYLRMSRRGMDVQNRILVEFL